MKTILCFLCLCSTVFALQNATIIGPTQIEEGQQPIYTLKLTEEPGSNISVFLSIEHIDTTTGDFEEDELVPAGFVFFAGQTEKTFTLKLKDDSVAELPEEFKIIYTSSGISNSGKGPRIKIGYPIGDSNKDGVFNSSDLILVLAAGQYEDCVTGNSTWETGDWNDDGEFDSSDLIYAFQQGTYEEMYDDWEDLNE